MRGVDDIHFGTGCNDKVAILVKRDSVRIDEYSFLVRIVAFFGSRLVPLSPG